MSKQRVAAPVKVRPHPAVSSVQLAAEIAGVRYWESPLPSRPLPRQGADGFFIFPDHPEFRPNLAPHDVLRVGAFGGGYFRSIRSGVTKRTYRPTVHEEFPPSWFRGVDVATKLTSEKYCESVNLYGVKSGNSLDVWETQGWIRAQDPYGWFQWYCRFFLGRRTEDDERQISRWMLAIGEKGRWRTYLVGQCLKLGKAWDDPTASPVTRQTLLHWGFKMTKRVFEAIAPALRKGKTVVYLGSVGSSDSASVKKRPSGLSARARGDTKRRRLHTAP
eukprot:TRINITY_DN45016_c0_g1_i1.p1 TRINITY_DN45016_c0_g1~~TRINITY_DN45016_c0_g1_i1.p1  ORF type:complete len:275 (+),score=15.87 TRINITY_DN45016_c0_g1_i1:41-865(+)